MMRSTTFAASTAAAALLFAGLGAAPAFAAEWTPSTFADLKAALATCADGDTIRLGADLTVPPLSPDWELVVACDVTLDLNGRSLAAEGVVIAPDTVLTITATGGGTLVSSGRASLAGIAVPIGSGLVIDGGTIVATGDSELDFNDGVAAAGIGGSLTAPDGSEAGVGDITINGGNVTAVGGDQVLDSGAAAGIGAAFASALEGGRLTVNGGTVTATGGGGEGVGIGGPADFEVAVTGGTVTAIGGTGSAAIGGAQGQPGAKVSITGGVVTATGGSTAIGAGAGSSEFGSLVVGAGAALRVPSGPFVIPDSDPGGGPEVLIEEGGQLLGTEADPTVGADLSGAGQIQNSGVIALDESRVAVEVADNNYLVSFDAQTGGPPASVRLYAPDFASGYRQIPPSPGGTVWNTSADGLGQVFTETTRVFADMTLYAVDDAFWQFALKLAECTDGDVIELGSDLAGGSLLIGCDVTLDLNGFALFASDVQVAVDSLLIIEDTRGGGELSTPALDPENYSGAAGIGVTTGAGLIIRGGTVTVAGGRGGAGIGGGGGQRAGFIRIEGGTVTATGGLYGAGIGGGYGGAGGDVGVTGGTVTAVGGTGASGIGGGETGDSGGLLTVFGGAVTAVAGSGGAGIGGGNGGAGAAVDIIGGTVTAVGVDLPATSAVGAGNGASEFGSLRVAGTLRVPEGLLTILDSDAGGAEVVVESGGRLVGTEADPTSGASIGGDGQIDNHGVIALQESFVGVEVNDHDFLVTFDPQDGDPATSIRLYAPDFASGYRTIPAPPELDGWNTAADGSGDWFEATTPVTGDLSLFATTDATLVLTADDDTVNQGDSLTFRVSGTTHDGRPVDTSGVVLTSSVATDVVDGLTVTFPTASPHVITATLGDVSTSLTVHVTPTPAPTPTPQPGPAGLSTTGTDLLPPLVAGLLLLLAGAGLVWRRRRLSR
jgi:hypothetical protein